MIINYNEIIKKTNEELDDVFKGINAIAAFNQKKVLEAFIKNRVSVTDFNIVTGYGYDDTGRDKLEKIYAEVFRADTSLVRIQIASGTHAITLCLFGNLRPGDGLLCGSGKPYDTLMEVIGLSGDGKGSLKEFGISAEIVPLKKDGTLDIELLLSSIKENTKMIYLQRSMGYTWRNGIMINELEGYIEKIKERKSDIIVFVDNCYGEFVEEKEPLEAGADIIAGSLIKNPGGTLAPTGGYIAGRSEYVENASYMLTSPGTGREVGASLGHNRMLYQGLFLAPHTVAEALKSAVFTARIFTEAGYEVLPLYNQVRTDIIQAVKINDKDKLIRFCQGLQNGSPVDSHVKPVPWDMPGYENEVIMAAGTFIQGASSELTADAPIKEPYIVYIQGGMVYEASKYAIISGIENMQGERDG
jgi:cystathionine beta-lyase family protein involved in aluminum resistance